MKLNSIAAKAVLSLLMVTLFSYAAYTQAITKAASIPYTNGVPTHTPSSVGSEIAINTVNKDFYFWNGTAWVKIVFGTGGNIAYTDVANTFTQNQIFTLPALTGSTATNGINITQTWNTTGAPSLLNVDLTNTASSGNARLFNFRIGGTSRFSMSATAQLLLGSNISLYPGLTSSGVGGGVNGPYFNISTVPNADYPGYSLNITSSAASMNVNPAVATNFAGGLNVSPGVFGINYTGANTIDYRPVNIAYTINNLNANSRTATGIFLNATETLLNGMTHNLMDLQMGGTSRFRVTNTGDAYVSAGIFRGSNQVLFTASGNEGLTLRDNVGTVRVSLSTNNNSYLTGGNLLLGTNTGTTANLNIATPSAVSYSAILTSGTWFTGGTSTTTKPHVLIEPAGATSTNWSTAGTGLGINAASGFTGNLLDLQLNGVSRASITSVGSMSISANMGVQSSVSVGGSNVWISGTGDGILRLTGQGVVNFERLQFGGTTSSFPALQTASSNTQTALAATFTNGSADIGTATNAYAVNQVVQFTTTSALPTGFTAGTNYFVVGTPTSTVIQVSGTQGGSAITAGSAGSGTHTVSRQTLAVFTNGSATVTTSAVHGLRVGDVIRFSNSGGSLPSSIGSGIDYYVLTIPTNTTFTYSANFSGTAITPPETALTATFSGTPDITTTTNTYIAGSVVRFTTTGTLPTGLSTGTDYYVIATSLSTTNIRVSATLGGTAIAYTGTGSGTHSVTRQILGNGIHFVTRNPGLYVRTADNSATAGLYAGNIVGNAPTGYTGRVFDLRVGTSTILNVDQVGNLVLGGNLTSGIITAGTYLTTPVIYSGGGGTTSFGNNVVMGAGGAATITASAVAEVRSTTAGFLPPRMTAVQAEAIASPAEGLMIYSTTGTGSIITSKGWWGWSGATWEKFNN